MCSKDELREQLECTGISLSECRDKVEDCQEARISQDERINCLHKENTRLQEQNRSLLVWQSRHGDPSPSFWQYRDQSCREELAVCKGKQDKSPKEPDAPPSWALFWTGWILMFITGCFIGAVAFNLLT